MPVSKRSSAIKVLGILNLVGGVLGLLSSLVAIVPLVLGPGAFATPVANNPFDPIVMDVYMVANAPG